jgi:hypothetical protein
MSVASDPISIACAISLIRSPAFVPTIAPPTDRCVSASKMSLVNPFVAAVRDRASGSRPRELRRADFRAALFRLVLGQADPGDLGSV